MNIRATIVDDIDSEAGQVAGAIELRRWPDRHEHAGIVAGFTFRCPCGCGLDGWLPINGPVLRGGPTWDWDGNADVPSLTPSVFATGWPCKWHGYLTAGEWRSC